MSSALPPEGLITGSGASTAVTVPSYNYVDSWYNALMPHVQLTTRNWLCRWDKCWIRLLDGMLQLSVAGTRDYELRIPTRIRSIVINNAAGTDDGQITVRFSLCLHPPGPYHVPLMTNVTGSSVGQSLLWHFLASLAGCTA